MTEAVEPVVSLYWFNRAVRTVQELSAVLGSRFDVLACLETVPDPSVEVCWPGEFPVRVMLSLPWSEIPPFTVQAVTAHVRMLKDAVTGSWEDFWHRQGFKGGWVEATSEYNVRCTICNKEKASTLVPEISDFVVLHRGGCRLPDSGR